MLTPLTQRQKVLIVNNVAKACVNIELLNKTGYNFLYLASGFIAHYNLGGFKDYYSRDGEDLRRDILTNAAPNMWRNFLPGAKDYEYYSAKANVYRQICNMLDPRPNGEWPENAVHKFKLLG